jgi:hypothetical protein
MAGIRSFWPGNDQIPAADRDSTFLAEARTAVVRQSLYLSQSSISRDAVAGRPDSVVQSFSRRPEREEEERERWFREREERFVLNEKKKKKKGCGILGVSVALSLYEAGKSTEYTKKRKKKKKNNVQKTQNECTPKPPKLALKKEEEEEEEEEQCSEDTK